ncbi:hypothetical protein C8Q75DRAFT_717484 [Abortiporus biennis]|nr:hypothetical protein C8Q75DRAFT_717484 [Abortiporus biennis]
MTEDESEIRAHPTLWFDDGNVVLVAVDGMGGFKLHRSILSRHSIVFRDLFTIPQPSEGETMEKCPVVRLQDSARDLDCLFTALYAGRKDSYYNRSLSVTFDEVTAMLRLGSKYQIDHIREEAIYRLQLCFPTSLSDFESEVGLHTNSEQPPISDLSRQDAICVVNLSRSFNLKSILPSAFYTCCQLDNKLLVYGVKYSDGTTEKLSQSDLLVCLNGRAKLLEDNTTITAFFCNPEQSPQCQYNSVCTRHMKLQLLQEVQQADIFANYDPLEPIQSWLSTKAQELRICAACMQLLNARYDSGRQRVWDNLGEYFGVEPWPWNEDE